MSDSAATAGWVVVVPVKRAEVAKTRLASFAGASRPSLARAFAADCVSAAVAASAVVSVVTVTDDADAATLLRGLGAVVVADEPDAGLNPALEHGAAHAARALAATRVAALSADLPALRSAELSGALVAAAEHDRAFVADTSGLGTTLLTSTVGVPLGARFGIRSRAAHHELGAVELRDLEVPSLRRDVDTEDDLRDALRLGVGAHTAGALASLV